MEKRKMENRIRKNHANISIFPIGNGLGIGFVL